MAEEGFCTVKWVCTARILFCFCFVRSKIGCHDDCADVLVRERLPFWEPKQPNAISTFESKPSRAPFIITVT